MKEKILQDTKEAMRSKDELRLSVLRMLSAAIHNREIEKRTRLSKETAEGLEEKSKLTEEETVVVVRSEVKKRRDAITEFEKGGRKDLVEKESAELKILEAYLPQELPDEEIEKIVKEVIAEIDVTDPKMFGRVMGEVMKRVKGQAGGERASSAVKKFLEK